MDFPTFTDLFRVARDEALAKNSALTRDIIERDGSDANALVAAGVAVGDSVTGQLIKVNAALFLDSSKGKDLDRLVFDRYQLLRKAASPAITSVDWTTTAPNPSNFDIPAGTQVQTSDNRVFATQVQVTFPAGSTGPIPVNVQSVLAGLNQQVRANTINNIVGVITGSPADLKVNNPSASAGADDEESDDDLRDRARRFYATSKRGTLKAIELGAVAVPGIRKATAFEVIDVNAVPARLVELVVADAFTDQLVDSTTLPPTYAAQAVAVTNAVQAGLLEVRAAGIQVFVTLATVDILGIQLSLRYRSGSDIDAATTAAKVAMVTYTNNLNPGATWDYSDAIDKLRTVPGLIVLGGEIISPAGDVVPASTLHVIRTSISYTTVGQALLGTSG